MTEANDLLALGEADVTLARLTKELAELPVKTEILEMRKKIRELEALLSKADAFVANVERDIARLEDEVASLDAKIAAVRQKAGSTAVADHKEVQNLMREAEALSRAKDKKETEIIELMERREAGDAKRAEIAAVLDKARARESVLIERYRAEGTRLQQQIAVLTSKRERLAASLDPALVTRYESVRDAKHGIGVARFADGRCSVCNIDLPAQKVEALRCSGPIGECPNCHRLLIVGADE